jgi:hypothetical protein
VPPYVSCRELQLGADGRLLEDVYTWKEDKAETGGNELDVLAVGGLHVVAVIEASRYEPDTVARCEYDGGQRHVATSILYVDNFGSLNLAEKEETRQWQQTTGL